MFSFLQNSIQDNSVPVTSQSAPLGQNHICLMSLKRSKKGKIDLVNTKKKTLKGGGGGGSELI